VLSSFFYNKQYLKSTLFLIFISISSTTKHTISINIHQIDIESKQLSLLSLKETFLSLLSREQPRITKFFLPFIIQNSVSRCRLQQRCAGWENPSPLLHLSNNRWGCYVCRCHFAYLKLVRFDEGWGLGSVSGSDFGATSGLSFLMCFVESLPLPLFDLTRTWSSPWMTPSFYSMCSIW